MKLPHVLFLPLFFVSSVSSSLNATQIATALPACALNCSITLLTAADCSLLDSAPCLCTNITLQSHLSQCVQQKCSIFGQQVTAANVQTEICEGYPQESRQSYLFKISLLSLCLVLPFLLMRICSRWLVGHKWWPDDYACILGLVVVTVGYALAQSATNKGFGKHYWNVDPSHAAELLKLFYALQVVYTLIQVTGKVAILLFYQRVFPSLRFRLLCSIVIGAVVAHGLAFILVLIFQCNPVNAAWDKSVSGKCVNLSAVGYAGAACSILEDFVILVVPLPQLGTLKVNLWKKIGLMFLFSVGSLACVTSMIRLKYLSSLTNGYDATFDNVDVLVWSILEVDITLICACLPALRPIISRRVIPLYRRMRGKAVDGSGSDSGSGSGSGSSHPRGEVKGGTRVSGSTCVGVELEMNPIKRDGDGNVDSRMVEVFRVGRRVSAMGNDIVVVDEESTSGRSSIWNEERLDTWRSGQSRAPLKEVAQ